MDHISQAVPTCIPAVGPIRVIGWISVDGVRVLCDGVAEVSGLEVLVPGAAAWVQAWKERAERTPFLRKSKGTSPSLIKRGTQNSKLRRHR